MPGYDAYPEPFRPRREHVIEYLPGTRPTPAPGMTTPGSTTPRADAIANQLRRDVAQMRTARRRLAWAQARAMRTPTEADATPTRPLGPPRLDTARRATAAPVDTALVLAVWQTRGRT